MQNERGPYVFANQKKYSRFLQGIQVEVDQPCNLGKQSDKASKELHMAKRGSP